jgi:hypothetical protein
MSNKNHDKRGRFSSGGVKKGALVHRVTRNAPVIGPGGVTGFKTVTHAPSTVVGVKKVKAFGGKTVKEFKLSDGRTVAAGTLRVQHQSLNRDHASEVKAAIRSARADAGLRAHALSIPGMSNQQRADASNAKAREMIAKMKKP